MRFQLAALHGRFVTPSYERAAVGDVMRVGLFTCGPQDSLVDVARLMATRHVHCVALLTGDDQDVHGVVSGLDLLRAAAADRDLTAIQMASSAFIRAQSGDRLADAVDRMVASGVDHAIVMRAGLPVGVLSSADVARVIGGGSR